MSRLELVKSQKNQRKSRVAATLSGTTERPRLSISISNKHITAQIIDDTKQKTIAYSSTVGKKDLPKTLTEQAEVVGVDIAKKAKTAKVSKVVLDRGSRKYHGRIKTLADAARKNGLEL